MEVTGGIALSRAREERVFYTAMAGVFVFLVLLGFGPSYYLPGWVAPDRPLLPATPLVHLHALLFSAWVLLFVLQTWLVATGQVAVHRRMGFALLLLAAAMLVVGALTALHQAARGSGPPSMPPLSWLAGPLLDMPIFAVLVGWASWNRRRPQIHKRLMLIAMVALMSPVVGRIPTPGFLAKLVLLDLGLIALAAWDLRSRGAVHPVTLVAGGLLVASQLLRVELSETAAWLHFARWAVSLVA